MYKVLPKYFNQMFVKSFANSIFKQLFELKYIKNNAAERDKRVRYQLHFTNPIYQVTASNLIDGICENSEIFKVG